MGNFRCSFDQLTGFVLASKSMAARGCNAVVTSRGMPRVATLTLEFSCMQSTRDKQQLAVDI